VVAEYWRLAALPIRQNIDYDFPLSRSPWGVAELASLALLAAILAAGCWLYRRDRPASFGIFWFFLALAVESGPIPIADAICEHRLYLPLFGFCLLAAACLWRLLARWDWPVYAAAAGILAVVLGVAAYQRNTVWKTELSLWTDTVRKSPRKARPLYNLGVVKKKAGEPLAARKLYDQVLRIRPDDYPALVDRGLLKREAGDLPGALADFDRAIRVKPGQVAAYLDRSQVRAALGDPEGALRDLNEAIRRRPDFFQAYVNRAAIRDSRGDEAGALADLDSAIRLSPDDPAAYNNRGTIRSRKGDLPGAIADFTESIRLKPDYAKAIANRGFARLRLRDTQGARSDLEAAQEILKRR
jgi:tetratricopeptide (TPR) repeat protein